MRRTNDDKRVTLWLAIAVIVLIAGAVANADFTFGEPEILGSGVNSGHDEYDPSISSDGLELYFNCNRPGGYGVYDIWVCTRATRDADWGEAVNLGPPVNTPSGVGAYAGVGAPDISADGLSLFFSSGRSGGFGSQDLYVTTRASKSGPWETPTNLGPEVNSSAWEFHASISADGLRLFFAEHLSGPFRPGGYGGTDIWVAERESENHEWETPVNLGPPISTSSYEGGPSISADGLVLFFDSNRSGGSGSFDLWMAKRTTTSDSWGAPVNLGSTVNSSSSDSQAEISRDGSTLYFSSARPGGFGGSDLWQAPIIPIVDFNGDGKIDGREILIMADHWGMDDSVCDIGPMPWGDGIVDVQDLLVLAEYIEPPVRIVSPITHWTLDETEGNVAHDGAGGHDGTIMGSPVWQPAGGAVDGALELNGATFVAADFVLSPADGPFSVFAWVKGGAPGQVIVSQAAGRNWLMADVAAGALMTELQSGDRTSEALCSDAVITDGNWHRVGFVWDDAARQLYVDDILVAEGTDNPLEGASDRILIGCGSLMTPNTFFTGLIDDVRIYDVALSAERIEALAR